MSVKSNQPIFSIDLPTKISGIVFWGAVVIGLIIAFAILQNKKNELTQKFQNDAKILQVVIVESLEHSQNPQFSPAMRIELQHNLRPFCEVIHCEAIEIKNGNASIIYGDVSHNQTVITTVLLIHPLRTSQTPYTVKTVIYFPSINQVLLVARKEILFSIGLMMMLFGLTLQMILQRLLARPFSTVLNTAQQFIDGNTRIRFEDSRNDEFGSLAKFINQALDSSAKNLVELSSALARAKASELALFAEKERIEVTLNSLSEAVITTNAEAIIEYLNPVAEKMSGWRLMDARGLPLHNVIHIVDEISRLPVPVPVYSCLSDNTIIVLPENAGLLRRDGTIVSIEATAAPMRNNRGDVVGAVMVCSDVSRARRLALQLVHQASHDILTNLYNRGAFESLLKSLLKDMPEDVNHTLLYIDLDQFKIVNDTCGHSAGDELLRQVGKMLQESVRSNDVLARLGGDEFGILLMNCDLHCAHEIAENIRYLVQEFRFAWRESVFEIGASIGVVKVNAENSNPTILMSSADLACYAAKDSGRNRVHVYVDTDDSLLRRRGEMQWTTMITQALEMNRFVLFYQPIHNLLNEKNTVCHWEILLRMKGDEGAFILPSQFIVAAERYNKMQSIDRWVIYNTFAAVAQGGFPVIPDCQRTFSINLSGETLGDETVLQFIQETGAKFSVDFSEICFEITETVAIVNLSKATIFIKALKALGCRFSLDDFGSGLSSFGYLKNLPVNFIKIDGGFIKDMAFDPIDQAMVEAINQIGHIMHMQTIAEWVEDEETLILLRQMGVDFAQGFHFGNPVPIALSPQKIADSYPIV